MPVASLILHRESSQHFDTRHREEIATPFHAHFRAPELFKEHLAGDLHPTCCTPPVRCVEPACLAIWSARFWMHEASHPKVSLAGRRAMCVVHVKVFAPDWTKLAGYLNRAHTPQVAHMTLDSVVRV